MASRKRSRITVESTRTRISYRPREAADLLGLGYSTLKRLTKEGVIPHSRVGRCVMYRMVDLQAFLRSHAEKNGGDA